VLAFSALRSLPYGHARPADDGKRYEIIDGELFVTPAPRRAHQRAVFRLAILLETLDWRLGGRDQSLVINLEELFEEVGAAE
jgi:Uma2 family endonuclease